MAGLPLALQGPGGPGLSAWAFLPAAGLAPSSSAAGNELSACREALLLFVRDD